MKSKVSVLVIASLLIGVFIALIQLTRLSRVGEFSLSEYQRELEQLSSTSDVGEVDTPQKAIRSAKELWDEKGFVPSTKREGIAYDQEAECWHVYSKPKANMLGGVAHAIIEKDGTVLALWMDD